MSKREDISEDARVRSNRWEVHRELGVGGTLKTL